MLEMRPAGIRRVTNVCEFDTGHLGQRVRVLLGQFSERLAITCGNREQMRPLR